MLKATEKALRASIKHWEIDGPTGVVMGGGSCALCNRFTSGDPNPQPCTRTTASGKTSERCPVYKKSGYHNCLDTPYNPFPTHSEVKAEVKFLKSLLPESKP